MTRLHRLRALFDILRPAERRMLVATSMVQALERVGVVLATASVAFGGPRLGAEVTAALGAVFFVRGVMSSSLRVRVRGRAVEVLVRSMLSEGEDLASPSAPDAEPALFEGLYATEEVLGQWLPQLGGDAVASMVVMALVARFEPPRILFAGLLAIGLGAAAAVAVRRVATESAQRQWRAFMPALEDLSTAVRARLEVVSNGGAAALERGVEEKLRVWRGQSARSSVVSFLAGRAPVVGAAAVVALFFLEEGGWGSGALAHAAVLASVTPAFAGLAKGALDLSRALVRASALTGAVMRAEAAPRDGTKEPALPAEVTWDAVTFAYAGETEPALRDVTVTWSPGELLGLAGQNGSGKSTFLRLLLGLHAPSKGGVRVGGVALSELRREALRTRVAHLVQRPYLPDRMTVAQAVALLAPEATAREVEGALERLSLWALLARRSPAAPLDVKLGALSAGEKQRVAIARVLMRRTPLVVLDEPDANLDAEGVARVAAVLREESRSRMVLVVAHSQALLGAMDRVVRFEAGRLV